MPSEFCLGAAAEFTFLLSLVPEPARGHSAAQPGSKVLGVLSSAWSPKKLKQPVGSSRLLGVARVVRKRRFQALVLHSTYMRAVPCPLCLLRFQPHFDLMSHTCPDLGLCSVVWLLSFRKSRLLPSSLRTEAGQSGEEQQRPGRLALACSSLALHSLPTTGRAVGALQSGLRGSALLSAASSPRWGLGSDRTRVRTFWSWRGAVPQAYQGWALQVWGLMPHSSARPLPSYSQPVCNLQFSPQVPSLTSDLCV